MNDDIICTSLQTRGTDPARAAYFATRKAKPRLSSRAAERNRQLAALVAQYDALTAEIEQLLRAR